MCIIRYFILVQAFALLLLLAAVMMFALQHYRYRKIKKLYRADYAKISFLKSVSRLLPLMPPYKSKRYRKAEGLIIDSGLRISVESFYLIKTALLILGFAFFISVQTTNTFLLYDSIVNDFNIEKSFIDIETEPDAADLRLEKEMFGYIEACLPAEQVSFKELGNKPDSQMYIEYIEARISGKWTPLKEEPQATAERMYKKLVRVRAIESGYAKYLISLVAALILYFIPNIMACIKLRLIEDKRDWEVLNYIYVFSVFGRMPPFNIKNVLSNILVTSDIYRPIINEAINGVKSGKGEDAFDDLLKRVENQELYELLEAMRLSVNTGLLNMMDNIDEMAANQLKWLEIKSIKRRKLKQVIAMVPVVLVMFMAVVYFSYSLSTLSNPMNFIK